VICKAQVDSKPDSITDLKPGGSLRVVIKKGAQYRLQSLWDRALIPVRQQKRA
jgi:hypothetical protein